MESFPSLDRFLMCLERLIVLFHFFRVSGSHNILSAPFGPVSDSAGAFTVTDAHILGSSCLYYTGLSKLGFISTVLLNSCALLPEFQ